MELDDLNWWKDFKQRFNGYKLSSEDYAHISFLHSKYFNHSFYKPCTCNTKTIKGWAKELDEFFKKAE